MRVFGGDKILAIMERLKVDDETPIENRIISKSLEAAQKKVEGFNFDQRKNVVQYDDVMNRHRRATYIIRREILKDKDISKRIRTFIEDEAKAVASSPLAHTEEYEGLLTEIVPLDENALDVVFDAEPDKFAKVLTQKSFELYESRESAFGKEVMREIEREVYLQVLDTLWMQHLENMAHLREGINWISVGQKDPLVEYRRQSQQLFEEMQLKLRSDIVKAIFSAQPINEMGEPVETELTRAARRSVDNADKIIEAEQLSEEDFLSSAENAPAYAEVKATKKHVSAKSRKKSRKAERKRRSKGRKR
jgi:preprotein translocase subunit SecA